MFPIFPGLYMPYLSLHIYSSQVHCYRLSRHRVHFFCFLIFMSRLIDLEPIGSDGPCSSFVTECFIRAWRNLLHNNKKVRQKALRGLIDSGQKPQILNILINKKGLGDCCAISYGLDARIDDSVWVLVWQRLRGILRRGARRTLFLNFRNLQQ